MNSTKIKKRIKELKKELELCADEYKQESLKRSITVLEKQLEFCKDMTARPRNRKFKGTYITK